MSLNNERFVAGNNLTVEEAREKIASVAWDDNKGIENFLVGRLVAELSKIGREYDLITSLYWTNPEYRMAILFANSSLKTSKSSK